MDERKRKTVLFSLILVIVLVWFRPIDMVAEQYTESGLKRALATFAAARTLNAVISVIRETSLSVEMGVGASVNPGAALDPLDDLVEQFSEIMLLSTLSFATQRLLIEATKALPVCVLLTTLLLAWLIYFWRRRTPPCWLPKIAIALLCLRLVVPTMALGSELVYIVFLSGEYETSQTQISNVQLPDGADGGEEGIMAKARRWWSTGIDLVKNLGSLTIWAENLVVHIVRLAAVFIVQTVVFPLVFLWGMLRLYRVFSAAASAK
jgi:hypothetical protein